MMEIESVKIRRKGGENNPNAEVVVEIQDVHGEWRELGRVRLDGAFSHAWNLPQAWRSAYKPARQAIFNRPECPFHYCDQLAPYEACQEKCRHT